MKTGSLGTFVISWSQTETDGLKAAPLDVLNVGATWRWTGTAVRVDGPQGVLILDGSEGVTDTRRRAAGMVRRLVGAAIGTSTETGTDEEAEVDLPDEGFLVTDGNHSFALTIIPVPDTGARLLMMVGDLPPSDRDLWVVRTSIDRSRAIGGPGPTGGVICFTPNTWLATPGGPRRIHTLQPGDLIETRDNGPQPVLWAGHRRMSGARLYAMPHLRPIRFRSGALGSGRPDEDLVVSPQHRMLIRGTAAQALFNTPEVLVSAENLVNDLTVTVDYSAREVTYVHVLLERHNIVWANGVETESFHPSNSALEMIDTAQRDGLLQILPDIAENPQSYGEYARRNLSASETAILLHDMAA
jgi:hypothetical protein